MVFISHVPPESILQGAEVSMGLFSKIFLNEEVMEGSQHCKSIYTLDSFSFFVKSVVQQPGNSSPG